MPGKKGLMHPNDGGYPLRSRDWPEVPCDRCACTYNIGKGCSVPSLHIIDEETGLCKGFKYIPKPPAKDKA